MKSCDCCLNEIPHTTEAGRSWYLSNYYGLSGHFCDGCYSLVSHDVHGSPKNSEEYTRIRVMFELKKSVRIGV